MSKTFFCNRQDIVEIRKQLQDRKVPIYTSLGNSPDMISGITACIRRNEQNGCKNAREKKVDIRIRAK
jgi:hypothetical protein